VHDGGAVVHAELEAAVGVVMLSGTGRDRWGDHRGQGWVHGSRDFSARDPEGNLWSFGTYAPS
jgi:uncharacterized glyoxalase superfamily protein PhnB